MRPLEYRDHLVGLLRNRPDIQGAGVIEDGIHPYALGVSAGGWKQSWQVIGQLAENAKHDTVTPAVEGRPPAFLSVPLVSSAADAWLAGVIGAAEPVDTKKITVWSSDRSGGPQGLTVLFHNGERAFLRLL